MAASLCCVHCNLARAQCRMWGAKAADQPTIIVVLSFLRLEEVGDGLANFFIVRLFCYLRDNALHYYVRNALPAYILRGFARRET